MHNIFIHNLKLFLLIPMATLLCCGQHHNRSQSQHSDDPVNEININPNINNDIEISDTLINKEYLLGQFEPSEHPLFSRIDSHLTSIKEGYLRKEALVAFSKMQSAAKTDGITLTIVSATRNFNAQKRIWEAKWNGSRKVDGIDLSTIMDPVERSRLILQYSSMPGTSRHHWGTDIDINSVNPEYFETPKGKREYQWLESNGAKYGFCQTYTPKDTLRPTGYEEEPWHWSFTPLSSIVLKRYQEMVSPADIRGFKGEETVGPLNVISDYVLGINPLCR